MSIKVKKIVSLTLACLFASLLFGCEQNTSQTVKGKPDYSNANKEFLMDTWYGPYATDEAFQDYVDCGFTHIHINNSSVSFNSADGADNSKTLLDLDNYLEYCKKYNLKATIAMNCINMNQHDHNSISYMGDVLWPVLSKWADSDTLYGYMPFDEPMMLIPYNAKIATGEIKRYEKPEEYIRDEYLIFNEMFPGKSYEPVILGPIQELFDGGWKSYDDYLETYCKNVIEYMPLEQRVITTDRYPFYLVKSDVAIREIYIEGIEAVALKSMKYHTKRYMYVQNYDFVKSPYMITYQYYTAMCYGYQGMTTWYYKQNGEKTAATVWAVDFNGNKTTDYYYLKEANEEIKSFASVYLEFADNWTGCLCNLGSERGEGNPVWEKASSMLSEHPRVKSISSTQDTLVGTFKDSNGYDGFVIANEVLPTGNIKDNVKITFNNANKAIVYIDGNKAQVVDLNNGELSLTLRCGHGAFVVPYEV